MPAGDLLRSLLLRRAGSALVQDDRARARWSDCAAHARAGQEAPDGDGGAGLRRGDDRVYYNTAAVLDADGSYLGKYRKTHIPHCLPGFWEKFYFTPGDLGYPVFDTRYARIGVYICYDRHFPEGARALGLAGAEIVFEPSATTAGHSEYLWEIEQKSHAVANGYFVGTNNRVGREAPWNFGEFYGKSYFCDPRGNILAQGSRDQDELIVADLDLEMIESVRTQWQFYRDRRPELYGPLARVIK